MQSEFGKYRAGKELNAIDSLIKICFSSVWCFIHKTNDSAELPGIGMGNYYRK